MRFQFVDRIDAMQGFKYARATKTISFEEGFVGVLHGETGCIPRSLLIECAAQLASWLVLYSTEFRKIPLIAKMEQAFIDRSVPCGTSVTLEVQVVSWNEEGVVLDSRISVEDRVIGWGRRCLCTFIDAPSLVDPEEMRIRLRELTKTARIE